MSVKACSECGAKFDGGWLDVTCPACKRQEKLQGAMQQQADASLLSAKANVARAKVDAAARVHVAEAEAAALARTAEAQIQIANAAELTAIGNAKRAELEGKAAYAAAIAGLDDGELQRVEAAERRRQDRDAELLLEEQIALAVACIETHGSPVAIIDSRVGVGGNAYPPKIEKAQTSHREQGIPAVYGWKNLKIAERILREQVEKSRAIRSFTESGAREQLVARTDLLFEKAKAQRVLLAREAVEAYAVRRTTLYASGAVYVSAMVGFTILAALSEGDWKLSMSLVWLSPLLAGGAVAGLIELDSWTKPSDFDEIRREAGRTSYSARAWQLAGLLSALILLGTVGFAVRGATPHDTPPGLKGKFARDQHSLSIDQGAAILDNALPLPLGNIDVKLPKGSFKNVVLHEGILSNDLCSGSLTRNGDELTVVVTNDSAPECNDFAGLWRVPGASAAVGLSSSPATPLPPKTPCDAVRGMWTATVEAPLGQFGERGSKARALLVDSRMIKISDLQGGKVSDHAWIGWNTSAPNEENGSCVFAIRDAIDSGNFVTTGSPYQTITKVRIKPDAEGVELNIDYDDPAKVPCAKCEGGKFSKEDLAKIQSSFKSINGSFWKGERK